MTREYSFYMADKHVDAEEVDFTFKTEQQYAFHLRLTPQLLEALIGAGQGREDVSIHFGSTPPENVSELNRKKPNHTFILG